MSLLLISPESQIFEFVIFHKFKNDVIQKANNENFSNKDFSYWLYNWLQDEKYPKEINLYHVDYDKVRFKIQHIT